MQTLAVVARGLWADDEDILFRLLSTALRLETVLSIAAWLKLILSSLSFQLASDGA